MGVSLYKVTFWGLGGKLVRVRWFLGQTVEDIRDLAEGEMKVLGQPVMARWEKVAAATGVQIRKPVTEVCVLDC